MKSLFHTILLLSAAMAPTQGVVADDVIAHYDMTLSGTQVTERITGTKYDVQHGTLAPVNVDGAAGKALRFDGYTNYIVAALPNQTLNEMTLSVWCAAETYPMMNTAEAENTPTYSTIVGNLDETAKKGLNIMLSSQGDLKVRFCSGGWGPYDLTASEKMPRTVWNNIAVTIGGNKITLYNNGRQLAQMNARGIDLGTAPLMIGKSTEEKKMGDAHINTFCGLIDDITLYNTAHSATVLGDFVAEHQPDFTYPASRYDNHAYAALWRPAFHGMPGAGWTNETHGLVFSGGRYHAFFQKNANGPYMARLHWGHISSENLYDWREENIAFGPSERYDIKGCWSGCVYQNGNLNGGRVTAYYTAVDNGKATICQAVADDDQLLTWTKTNGNPLVNGRPNGLSDDFRDCYLFEAGGNQYMIVGTSKDNVAAATLHRYNGGAWTNDGSIFFKGASKATAGRFMEMPNVTRMGDKYLLTATPLETSVGVETLYWVGTINADGTFNAETPVANPGKLDLDGFSRDGYGMLSPSIMQLAGKTIALGIVPDKLATQYNMQIGWAHNYSLPREWTLEAGELVQKPYSGLAAMRSETTFAMTDKALNGHEPLGEVTGRTLEVKAEFTVPSNVNSGSEFGLTLLGDGTKGARLYYTPATNMLTLDMSSLERVVNDAHAFNGIYQSALPQAVRAGETLRLHVFLDHSILDIFVNDRWAASVRVFPTNAEAVSADVYATTETTVKSLHAWVLDAKLNANSINRPQSTDPSETFDSHSTLLSTSYDLLGRPTPPTHHSVCIQGGRKVLVK